MHLTDSSKRLLFAWAFRFVLREKHMCHMFLFPVISVLLHWEWLRLTWRLENSCQNKSRKWRVCLCLPFSHCCNMESTSLADYLKGAPPPHTEITSSLNQLRVPVFFGSHHPQQWRFYYNLVQVLSSQICEIENHFPCSAFWFVKFRKQ